MNRKKRQQLKRRNSRTTSSTLRRRSQRGAGNYICAHKKMGCITCTTICRFCSVCNYTLLMFGMTYAFFCVFFYTRGAEREKKHGGGRVRKKQSVIFFQNFEFLSFFFIHNVFYKSEMNRVRFFLLHASHLMKLSASSPLFPTANFSMISVLPYL
jgi:hypothetical protein